MSMRQPLFSVGLVVLGGLLGSLASLSRIERQLIADESSAKRDPSVNSSCCDTGADRSVLVASGTTAASASHHEQNSITKPKILVIMGDETGIWNLSAFHQGMMGYKALRANQKSSGIAGLSWRFQFRTWSAACSRRSSSFLPGRSPPASPSIRPWKC